MHWLVLQLDAERPRWIAGLVLVAVVLAGSWLTVRYDSRRRRALAAALRTAIVVLLVLSLAGLLYRGTTSRPYLVFAIDRSASVDTDKNPAANEFLREAIGRIAPADCAWVQFAGRAVEGDSSVAGLDVLESDPAEALRLAARLIPTEYVPRIVLLTDGQPTRGDLLAAAQGLPVPVDVVPLRPVPWPEVRVAAVRGPELARRHEPVEILVTVQANRDVEGHVELREVGGLAFGHPTRLAPGVNEVRLATVMRGHETATYEVRLTDFADTLAENNAGRVAVRGVAPPRLLLVTGPSTPGVERLREPLAAAGIEVVLRDAGAWPTRGEEWAAFDAVFLADVEPAQIGAAAVAELDRLVSGRGGGLIVVGGDATFAFDRLGATGLEAILPVQSTLRDEEAAPTLALLLVIDRSGSMREQGRMELAKLAAQRCVDLDRLSARDQVGVLAFGQDWQWIAPLGPCRDKEALKQQIDSLVAEGTTEMYPALVAACLALEEVPADRRHAIVLTDGIPSPGDYAELAAKMAAAGITVSTVSVGGDADQAIVRDLARIAGGRHYHCDDAAAIPEILVADARKAAEARSLVPQSYGPLEGLDVAGMPPLGGYALTSPRPEGELMLLIGGGDPLLAWRQYGRGISVAFTSSVADLQGATWREWEGSGPFWAGLCRLAMRHAPVRLAAAPSDGDSQSAAAVIPEELRVQPVNEPLLRRVAEVSGGRYNPTVAEVCSPDGRTAAVVRPLWRYLLMVCAVIFVADVAVRRWRHE